MSKARIIAELPRMKAEERAEIRAKLAELDGDQWLDSDDPLTEREKVLLEARLAACEKDLETGSTWAEAEARIHKGLAK